jgi:hypothetical protein
MAIKPKKGNNNNLFLDLKGLKSKKNNSPIEPIQTGSFINPVVQKNKEG